VIRECSDSCEQGKPSIQILKKPTAQKTARIQSAGHDSFLDIDWMHLEKTNKSESREGPKATYKTTHDLVTIFHTILPYWFHI